MKWMVVVSTIAVILLSVILFSSNSSKDSRQASSDAALLASIVDLGVPVTNIRWEVFDTPEDDSGIPAPNDLETLIAEVTPSSWEWYNKSLVQVAGTIVAPEASRPWLLPEFRQILGKSDNGTADLSGSDCKRFQALLRTDNRKVHGFACRHADKALLYLTMYSSIEVSLYVQTEKQPQQEAQ